MNIDGATRLYAIIGDPVVQVRSPAVHTAHFAERGINAVMFAAQASRESFDAAIRGLMALGNLDGLLITSPHKTSAMAFADELSTRVKIVGAINALRREPDGSWTGDMFDGVGFVGAAQKIVAISGKRALLFGCGGAGAAIAAELAAHGARSIALVDPSEHRALALRDALATYFDGCSVTVGNDGATHEIVINASIVGMKEGDGLPGDPGVISDGTLVGDVVLRPPATPTVLVRLAQEAGAHVVTGQDMHAGQVDAISAFFKGVR
jgi:shikimate dehydrogenase